MAVLIEEEIEEWVTERDGKLEKMFDESEAQPLVLIEPRPVTDPKSFWDRYQILGKLGQGGEGHVHKVKDVTTGQLYAAKVINLHNVDDWSEIRKMERDIEVLRTLDHPGIVKCIDYHVEETDTRYGKDVEFVMVTELAAGKRLSDVMKDHSFTSDEMEEIQQQVMEALSYVHERGIIHRDVKLDNIVMDNRKVKLIDFGVAKVMGQTTRATDVDLVGTITHMAPEMFLEGAEITPAVDFYGLGVSMIELAQRKQLTELAQPELLEKKLNQLKQLSSGYRERLRVLIDEDPEKRMADFVREEELAKMPTNAIAGAFLGGLLGMTAGIVGAGLGIDYIQAAIGYSGLEVYAAGYMMGGTIGVMAGKFIGSLIPEKEEREEVKSRWYSSMTVAETLNQLDSYQGSSDRRCIPYLREAMTHPAAKVRKKAIQAASTRQEDLHESIRDLKKNDPSWWVRREARLYFTRDERRLQEYMNMPR